MSFRSEDDALYFPSIEIQSLSWLRASLLMWDHVYRIVPDNYAPHDSNDVRAAVDAGFLRTISLQEADRREAGESFERMLEAAPVMPDAFQDDEPVPIHFGKIDERLYPALDEVNARLVGNWYEMPRGLARGYMLSLAETVARRRTLSLATDNPDAWTATIYVGMDGNIGDPAYSDETEDQVAAVSIERLLPVFVDDLPIAQLLGFAAEHAEERREFRRHVTGFLNRLARCESAKHAEDMLADLGDGFRKRIEALRKLNTGLRSNRGEAALIVGVPTTLTAISALSTIAGSMGGWLASLLIGTVATLADSTRARRTREKDMVGSYFLDVESLGSNRQGLPHLSYLMNEFVND